MSESTPIASRAMVVGIIGGTSRDFREIGMPFQADVLPSLKSAGMTSEDCETVALAFPGLPAFPAQRGPQAVLFEVTVLGFAVYLAKKLTDPTIDALGKQIYEKGVQPALDRLGHKIRRKEIAARPLTAQFDHWFDGSQVLVRVLIRCEAGADTPAAVIVPAALRSAAEWLQRNPVTHRVLTYEVINGVIPSSPDLTEPI